MRIAMICYPTRSTMKAAYAVETQWEVCGALNTPQECACIGCLSIAKPTTDVCQRPTCEPKRVPPCVSQECTIENARKIAARVLESRQRRAEDIGNTWHDQVEGSEPDYEDGAAQHEDGAAQHPETVAATARTSSDEQKRKRVQRASGRRVHSVQTV